MFSLLSIWQTGWIMQDCIAKIFTPLGPLARSITSCIWTDKTFIVLLYTSWPFFVFREKEITTTLTFVITTNAVNLFCRTKNHWHWFRLIKMNHYIPLQCLENFSINRLCITLQESCNLGAVLVSYQLVEHRATVREVAGSKPQPDQHSGSFNNWGESAAFVMTSANG